MLEDSPFYDESGYKDDYAWRRNVKWLTDKPVPRSHASNTLQHRLKCRQTCIDISTLSEHLQAALHRSSPISFKDELYTDSRPVVFKHLLDSVTDIQLETLIEEIYLAQGHDAKRLPKKQQQDGDVDIRVEIDTGLGADSKPLAISIQVKQHEGMTDKYAVQQIAARPVFCNKLDDQWLCE